MMDVKTPFSTGLTEKGITYEQAMEIHRLWNEDSIAAPTIATRTEVDYNIVCEVLAGVVFPGARRLWADRAFP